MGGGRVGRILEDTMIPYESCCVPNFSLTNTKPEKIPFEFFSFYQILQTVLTNFNFLYEQK